MPRLSKKFALLLVLAMLASMFVGMGTVSAASDNTALSITNVPSSGSDAILGTLRVQESSSSIGGFVTNQQITINLPSGVEYGVAPIAGTLSHYAVPDGTEVTAVAFVAATTKTLTVSITRANPVVAGKGYVDFIFNDKGAGPPAWNSKVATDGASSDIAIEIYAPSTGITSGSVVVAHATEAGTTATVIESKTKEALASAQPIGTVRVAENRANSIKLSTGADGQLKIVAPADVTITAAVATAVNNQVWDATLAPPAYANTATVAGGTNTDGYSQATFTVKQTAAGTVPGFINVDLTVTIDDDTIRGPLNFIIKGDGVTTQTVAIGTIAETGFTTAVTGDPKNIKVGAADQAINNFTLAENMAGAFINGKDLKLTLPSWAHWYKTPVVATDTGGSSAVESGANPGDVSYTTDSNRNTRAYTVTQAGAKSTLSFKDGKIFLDATAPVGDLTLEITGKSIGESIKVVVGKVIAPVTATATSKDVKIGVAGQAGSDIIITEAAAGILKYQVTTIDNGWTKGSLTTTTTPGVNTNVASHLLVKAPSGVTFSQLPTVTVSTGDLKVDPNNVSLIGSDTTLDIPIQKTSTAASTITISNVKYTVYRTVPEGDVTLTLTGNALDQTIDSNNLTENAIVSVVAANTVTPAPGEIVNVASFVIGSTKLTINGAETTMDVAPYIKDGRTFLPLAYVAQALGVTSSNIIWDAANQTVTLMKGDKVVQVKIGSTTMLVNGAAITLDVAPEISSNRTCLPVALLAQAFGSTANWDAATQTVTIK